MSKEIIKTENLVRKFITGNKEIVAVNNISLCISSGEFVAIIGRSGSGKSTLLYQLSLLDTPTAGEIIVDGINVSTLSDTQKTSFRLNNLGYVFQDYALMPSLTALDNIMLPLLMKGMPTKQAKELSLESLSKVGLKNKENNLPNQLSGGEQQRVSIARAVAHKPKILFADEPTANLDSETAELIINLFKDLHKEGQTIIMVTHETDYTQIAEKVIKLADGKIVKV